MLNCIYFKALELSSSSKSNFYQKLSILLFKNTKKEPPNLEDSL